MRERDKREKVILETFFFFPFLCLLLTLMNKKCVQSRGSVHLDIYRGVKMEEEEKEGRRFISLIY